MVALNPIEYVNGHTYTLNAVYIGVTPGTLHNLKKYRGGVSQTVLLGVKCGAHDNVTWVMVGIPRTESVEGLDYIISWSPEINTHTPTVTDY